jgi:hypothetical protein
MKCTNATGHAGESCEGKPIQLTDNYDDPVKWWMFPNLVVSVFVCSSCGGLSFFKNDEATKAVIEELGYGQRRTIKE